MQAGHASLRTRKPPSLTAVSPQPRGSEPFPFRRKIKLLLFSDALGLMMCALGHHCLHPGCEEGQTQHIEKKKPEYNRTLHARPEGLCANTQEGSRESVMKSVSDEPVSIGGKRISLAPVGCSDNYQAISCLFSCKNCFPIHCPPLPLHRVYPMRPDFDRKPRTVSRAY